MDSGQQQMAYRDEIGRLFHQHYGPKHTRRSSMSEVARIDQTQVASAAEMQTHVQRIQQVMQAVMKSDTHYGVIPGTQKPTLYKAGSEVLLTTFRIAVDPVVEDLSDGDHIRFRVIARGVHQTTGTIIGAGIGECSSAEEKYCWRDAVCPEEWEATDPDRRRIKYAKGRDGHYTRSQVRTNSADLANTILKMAKKRAQIDMTLTALAASDIFTQDLEDLPEGMRHVGDDDRPRTKPRTTKPAATNGNGMATEKQLRLIGARLSSAGIDQAALLHHFGIDAIEDLPFASVNDALSWIQSGGDE